MKLIKKIESEEELRAHAEALAAMFHAMGTRIAEEEALDYITQNAFKRKE